MKFTRNLKDMGRNDTAIAGGKGFSLGRMIQAGIPVPDGFVILSTVFEHISETSGLKSEIKSILYSVNSNDSDTIKYASEKIRKLVFKSEIPENISHEIMSNFDLLHSQYVAVRSSTPTEDSADATWAGILESHLETTREDLLENIKKCWASLFTHHAIQYGFEKGLDEKNISIAIVIQKMVKSEKSGVAFSVHPVTQNREHMIIEAGSGLGEAVVSGKTIPDSYIVRRKSLTIVSKSIHGKRSILSENETLKLSEMVLTVENLFGFPVDVEWAYEKRKFFILQSRPITTLTEIENRMVLVGKRRTDKMHAELRIKGWTEGLKKEIGTGYRKIVINSGGEHFVDSESRDEINELLSQKSFQDFKFYSDKMRVFRGENFSDLFTYFLIARHTADGIYKTCSSEQQKAIEEWRNDENLFQPLDEYIKTNPVNKSKEHWKWEFYNGKMVLTEQNEKNVDQGDKGGLLSKKTHKEIKGEPVYGGVVHGTVKIVENLDDLAKITEGDIAVAQMMSPDCLPIIKKSRAIITDEGGILSHTAIMAREMEKPCIVGTGTATTILKDGDQIKIDAASGMIHILS